jgi:TonB family protein
MPSFPLGEPPAKGRNVAVLEIGLNEAGNVSDVRILQSPGPRYTKVLLASAMKWKFKPRPSTQVTTIRFRIPIYFVVDESGKRVVSASWNAPFVGLQY